MQLKNWIICSVHKPSTWNVKTFYTVFSSTCRLGTNKKTCAVSQKCWMISISCVDGVFHGLPWTRAGQQKFVHAAMWYTLHLTTFLEGLFTLANNSLNSQWNMLFCVYFCWRDISVLNNENGRMFWRIFANYCSWNHVCLKQFKNATQWLLSLRRSPPQCWPPQCWPPPRWAALRWPSCDINCCSLWDY